MLGLYNIYLLKRNKRFSNKALLFFYFFSTTSLLSKLTWWMRQDVYRYHIGVFVSSDGEHELLCFQHIQVLPCLRLPNGCALLHHELVKSLQVMLPIVFKWYFLQSPLSLWIRNENYLWRELSKVYHNLLVAFLIVIVTFLVLLAFADIIIKISQGCSECSKSNHCAIKQ